MKVKHRHRIGQVILDKAANIKTVVNKTGIIETKFRTFPMEVLAGDANTIVDMKVNGLRFKFDFAKVYWNTRLSDEHERLVIQRFSPNDLIIDAFCGVGPFAIRAAKKGCAVMANDLNPESVAALVENVKLNKLSLEDYSTQTNISELREKKIKFPSAGTVQTFNTDARDFLGFSLSQLRSEKDVSLTSKIHVVMNLPATSIDFLDAMKSTLNPTQVQSPHLPFVHCYCFSSGATLPDRQLDVTNRILRNLGLESSATLSNLEIRDVRDVAPNKYMLCAHFQFPSSIAYSPSDTSSPKEASVKRVKEEEEEE